MNTEQTLREIGLSDGEAKVYLALLKLGPSPVSNVKQETQLHRTTIYDFVEKLLNKGLISYVIQNNVKFFKAANPERLLEYVKEKEESIKQIMSELKELSSMEKQEVRVEIYKGREGFKTVLNDIIKTKQNIVSYGIDERKFMKRFPILMENYFAKEREAGIKERILTAEHIKEEYQSKSTEYRRIPKQFFNPTPTIVYGEKVLIIIQEPFVCILIEQKELADSYRKYFEMLWEKAK
jgi:HTH-type transcriptional regulator, sugar sensing transcriptional regulator